MRACSTNTFKLCWIILENNILICLPTFLVLFFKLAPLTAKLSQYASFFSSNSLHTPLHGLAFYSFNHPLYLLPSYLNHAFVYFNQISATIYLIIISSTCYRIYKLKSLHKLTTEYTLHSRVKLSIPQNMVCCFS